MSAFHKNRSRRDGLQTYCRPCLDEFNEKVRLRNKLLVLLYLLTHPCVDCGEADPVVLEFDHRGKKKAAISWMVGRVGWKVIAKEMARCKVLCANCHRRKTARERGWFRAKVSGLRLEASGRRARMPVLPLAFGAPLGVKG